MPTRLRDRRGSAPSVVSRRGAWGLAFLAVLNVFGSGAPTRLCAEAGPHTLTLPQAIELARDASPAIESASLHVVQAEAAERSARAQLFPLVSARVSATYNAIVPDPVSIEAGSFGSIPNPLDPGNPTPLPESNVAITEAPEDTFYSVSATIDQPLYTAGRLHAAAKAASLGRALALVRRDAADRDVETQVREAYLATVFAEGGGVLLSEMSVLARANARDQHEALAEGTVTREAVLEAELGAEEISSEAMRFGELAASTRTALNVLMAGAASKDASLQYEFRESAPALDEAALVARALERSTSRAEAEIRVEQAAESVRIAMAERPLRPNLGLRLSGEVSGQQLFASQRLAESWETALRITLSANLPVFDGGRAAAAVQESEARAARARIAVDAAEDEMRLAVRDAVSRVRTADARLAGARAALSLASQRLRNAEASLENDVATQADVRSARIGELEARLAILQAGYDLELGLADLAALCGRALSGGNGKGLPPEGR